jgi:hypothetical protein
MRLVAKVAGSGMTFASAKKGNSRPFNYRQLFGQVVLSKEEKMRHFVAPGVIGLSAACSFAIAVYSANGAQATRPEPAIRPTTTNGAEQPPATPPGLAPNPFRRGMRPRFAPRGPQAVPPAMTQPAPPAAPSRPLQSVFLIPSGLSMPPEDLYQILNYDPVKAVPLTPQTCFDIAYQCYLQEYYSDAIVFARHGLTMCNDARLHLLKGVCELHLARGADAEKTASEFRNALTQQQFFGMEAAHERINEPLSVRFDAIVEYQNTGR